MCTAPLSLDLGEDFFAAAPPAPAWRLSGATGEAAGGCFGPASTSPSMKASTFSRVSCNERALLQRRGKALFQRRGKAFLFQRRTTLPLCGFGARIHMERQNWPNGPMAQFSQALLQRAKKSLSVRSHPLGVLINRVLVVDVDQLLGDDAGGPFGPLGQLRVGRLHRRRLPQRRQRRRVVAGPQALLRGSEVELHRHDRRGLHLQPCGGRPAIERQELKYSG